MPSRVASASMVDDMPYSFWEKPDEPFEPLRPDLIRCTDWTRRICSQLTLIEDFPERYIDDVYALLADPETHCVVAATCFPHHPEYKRWNARRWGTSDGVRQKRPDVAGALITDLWKHKRTKRCEVIMAAYDDRVDGDYIESWLVEQLLEDCRAQAWECVSIQMRPEDPSSALYRELGFSVADVTRNGIYIYEWSPDAK